MDKKPVLDVQIEDGAKPTDNTCILVIETTAGQVKYRLTMSTPIASRDFDVFQHNLWETALFLDGAERIDTQIVSVETPMSVPAPVSVQMGTVAVVDITPPSKPAAGKAKQKRGGPRKG